MKLIATAVALAALPLALAPAGAQVAPAILPDGTILDVTATGQTSRVPDVATIRAGVVTQAATAGAAISDNAQAMARILAALKRAGIVARDVSTSNVGLNPQYRYVENQAPVVTGYQATNTVSVRFRDIAKSGAILDALVKEGANQIDGPNLAIDNPDAALDEARADAVKRARTRAELYARAAGMSVSRIVSIAENGENPGGSPPPVLYARAAKAEDASTQIAPGETDVTVTLSVRFLLK
ncbi:SIMPL domain-containing protein [Sphingomonas alpina]|uniref:SIMPL domain-containing protein n=1 Tax=Sphingomonas alpina TaxID=653931 RepID=A0A7H0LIK2_9SPHN|nr:SIMPL domain-containing protein [Sphingomonas alpina]QNQ09505.1 SIMPL domain-containing protein [Sphingomonas alpina]